MRVMPAPVGVATGRIDRSCFGPRLMAAVATMATVERLTGQMIQERLRREYGLMVSHGGIMRLPQRPARAGTAAYTARQGAARASPAGMDGPTHSTEWPQRCGLHDAPFLLG
jgi:hypothetical protein